jgi:hypothetical protein
MTLPSSLMVDWIENPEAFPAWVFVLPVNRVVFMSYPFLLMDRKDQSGVAVNKNFSSWMPPDGLPLAPWNRLAGQDSRRQPSEQLLLTAGAPDLIYLGQQKKGVGHDDPEGNNYCRENKNPSREGVGQGKDLWMNTKGSFITTDGTNPTVAPEKNHG